MTDVGFIPAQNVQTTEPATSEAKKVDGVKIDMPPSEEIPSKETIKKMESYEVFDNEEKLHSFKSLLTRADAAQRTLVVFVRQFFCPYCQKHLQQLCEEIPPDALKSLPISTQIIVLGYSDPTLIDGFREKTKCPYPIYTDPECAIFGSLGMAVTSANGQKPSYTNQSMFSAFFDGLGQGLRQIPKGLGNKAPLGVGNPRQQGGEALFETAGEREDMELTWCFRMKDSRNHSELSTVKKVLGLE